MASTTPAPAYPQLNRTFAAVDRAHERWLAAVGSNGARCAVLAALAAAGQPITPSALAETIGRSPNALSPLLRGLQDDGLIKRSANAQDRRSHFIHLTATGRRTAQRLAREEAAFVRAAFGGRSQREMEALTAALRGLEQQAAGVQRGA